MPSDAYVTLVIKGGPNVVAASEDAIWVELHRANEIAKIDPSSMAVTVLPGVAAHCFVSASASEVWATRASDSRVTRIDPVTGEPILTVQLLDACGVSVVGDSIWVTSPSSSRIFRLDPTTGATELEVDVPAMPFVLAQSSDAVWASGEGGGGWMAIVDAETGRITRTRTSPDMHMLDDIAFGFGSAWAVGRASSMLYRLDPMTGDTLSEVVMGPVASGVAVGDDAVWVTLLGGTLLRVDPVSEQITGAWQLPFTWLTSPRFAFGSLWMASLEENALIRLDPNAVPSPDNP